MKWIWYWACLLTAPSLSAQLNWENVSREYGALPQGIAVFRSLTPLDGAPCIAYYVEVDLNQKHISATVDTTRNRRLTPTQFYERNNAPVVVVNGTFFSFATNQNLNLVIKDKKIISYNPHSIPGRGKDTLTFAHPFSSAIGVRKNRKPDVALTFTDTLKRRAYEVPKPLKAPRDAVSKLSFPQFKTYIKPQKAKPWKMYTAIGGGPILLQNGQVAISNNEEMKFAGKALYDKHPRTAMGYTADGRLIILAVQGRSAEAVGVTLEQEATLLQQLGCVEALNLDGGGSSCLLVNGKPTIRVSDKEGQRPVPAVWMIRTK